MLFDHYANLYLTFKKDELKHSTYCKYEGIVEKRLKPFFFGKQIEEQKVSDCKLWLHNINDVSIKSKRHYVGVLSGIFDEAYYDEVIDKNPAKFLKLPKYRKPTINPFNADEVQSIVDDSTDNINYMFYLSIAFYTGMRSGEIIALKKDDVKLGQGIIEVTRTRSKYGESSAKTISGRRQIPILDILRPYLEKLIALHDHEYLFITQYRKPYVDNHVFNNQFWKPSLKRLDIKYRRPYNTRHTYATNMLYRDLVTPVQLAQLLGHANTQMVYDVYVAYLEKNYSEFDRSMKIYV